MARFRHRAGSTWLLAASLVASLTVGCAAISRQPTATDAADQVVGVPWVNWKIECTPVGNDRIRILLRKNPLTSSGNGDAWQLFASRAEQLVHDGGYASYTVLAYTESVDSNFLVAQRVSQGLVRLNH